MSIEILKECGDFAIGEKDGVFYRGTPRKICFSELKETVEVLEEGGEEIVISKVGFGDYEHSEARYSEKAYKKFHYDNAIKNKNPKEVAKKIAEKMWDERKKPGKRTPVKVYAVNPEGELVKVAKMLKIYEWEKMDG